MQPSKHIPLVILILLDICAIGASLCVFALFHHVIPVTYSYDLSKQTSVSAPAETTEAAAAQTEQPPETDGIFTSGEIIRTEDEYKSSDISITKTKAAENGVTYYILDIYLKDIKCLKTAFANDKYGKGIVQYIPDMAENNLAIAAVNGDYYGTHTNRGVIIRNGYLYRANEAYGDVCFLFNDGSMSGCTEAEFNKNRDKYVTDDIYQGWCFGPLLVTGGKAITGHTGDISGLNPRTGIGYYEVGHYCLIVVDGRADGYSIGMTLDEFGALFESLGCSFAFNLDGGQSSMMVFNGGIANRPYKGGRDVSDIIYITEDN